MPVEPTASMTTRKPPKIRLPTRNRENHIQPRLFLAGAGLDPGEIKGGALSIISRGSLPLGRCAGKQPVCDWSSAWVTSGRGTQNMATAGIDARLCGEPLARYAAAKLQRGARAAFLRGILAARLDGLGAAAGNHHRH